MSHPFASSVKRLLQTIRTWHSKSDPAFGMFTCYFEASGDEHTQLLLVVAGFVSSAEQWIEWEQKWLERLAEDGLEYFHNAELYGWECSRKVHLIADLSEITSHYMAHKFGVIIKNTDLVAGLSRAARDKWHIGAYSLAGRTIVSTARLWADSWGGRLPELIFEKGDKGHGKLRHLMVTQGYPEPIFRPKRAYRDKKSGFLHSPAVPLQAGDLLASQIFAMGRSVFSSKGVQGKLYRINDHLDKISGEFGVVESNRYGFIEQGLQESNAPIVIPNAKIKTS